MPVLCLTEQGATLRKVEKTLILRRGLKHPLPNQVVGSCGSIEVEKMLILERGLKRSRSAVVDTIKRRRS